MAGANKITAAHMTSILDAVLESDETIQEMLEAFFNVVTDDQLITVLTEIGYNYDDFEED